MADEQKSDQLTGRASIRAGSYQPGEGLVQTAAQKAAAGPTPAPKTVSMEILRDGSYGGKYHHAGDSVDVPEDHVETLTLSGFAARTDRAEVAQQARYADAAEAETAKDTAVAPVGTADMPKQQPAKAKR